MTELHYLCHLIVPTCHYFLLCIVYNLLLEIILLLDIFFYFFGYALPITRKKHKDCY